MTLTAVNAEFLRHIHVTEEIRFKVTFKNPIPFPFKGLCMGLHTTSMCVHEMTTYSKDGKHLLLLTYSSSPLKMCFCNF